MVQSVRITVTPMRMEDGRASGGAGRRSLWVLVGAARPPLGRVARRERLVARLVDLLVAAVRPVALLGGLVPGLVGSSRHAVLHRPEVTVGPGTARRGRGAVR